MSLNPQYDADHSLQIALTEAGFNQSMLSASDLVKIAAEKFFQQQELINRKEAEKKADENNMFNNALFHCLLVDECKMYCMILLIREELLKKAEDKLQLIERAQYDQKLAELYREFGEIYEQEVRKGISSTELHVDTYSELMKEIAQTEIRIRNTMIEQWGGTEWEDGISKKAEEVIASLDDPLKFANITVPKEHQAYAEKRIAEMKEMIIARLADTPPPSEVSKIVTASMAQAVQKPQEVGIGEGATVPTPPPFLSSAQDFVSHVKKRIGLNASIIMTAELRASYKDLSNKIELGMDEAKKEISNFAKLAANYVNKNCAEALQNFTQSIADFDNNKKTLANLAHFTKEVEKAEPHLNSEIENHARRRP